MSTARHLNQQQFSAFKDPAPKHAPATGRRSVPDLDAREWGTLMGHIATMAPGEPLDDLGPSHPISGPPPARPQTAATSRPPRVDKYEDLSPAEISHRRANKVAGIHEDYTDPDYKPM